MIEYRVRIGITITPGHESDDRDAFTDDMMDEIHALDATGDMGGSVTTGEFDVWVTVKAQTPVAAAIAASGIVRTAAHAAGGSTSAWPTAEDEWPTWLRATTIEAHPLDQDSLVSC